MREIDLRELRVERALAVGAHPDDAEFSAGGTLIELAGLGVEVTLVVCTDGARGGRGVSDAAAVRRREQADAAKALGLAHFELLGHPDGELVCGEPLRAELVHAIRRFRPDLVLAHDPETLFRLRNGRAGLGHSDHRAAGLGVLDALYPRAGSPNFYPEQLRDGIDPWGPRYLFLFDTARADARVPIAAALERKLDALRCHRSQLGPDEGMLDYARKIAAEQGATEAFLVLQLRR